MLVLVQFPFADLRGFSIEVAKLHKPSWPPIFGLGVTDQFTRYFGGSEKRNRGPDYAWLDELGFYSARRAIRFTNLTLAKPFKIAFRRLLSDGEAVSRIEIGINYTGFDEQVSTSYLDSKSENKCDSVHKNPMHTVRKILELPTVVSSDCNSLKELGLQAKSLTRLYSQATTPTGIHLDHELVKACIPLVLVECGTNEFDSLPRSINKSPPNSLHGARLGYGELKMLGGTSGVWFINYGDCDFEYARSIRLCVTRLHAEREVLRCTLDALQSGTIEYKARTDSANRLEAYLNNKISFVSKKSWQGVEQSAIQDVFELSCRTLIPFETGLLEERLNGARHQISLKVRNYSKSINVIIEDLDMSTTTITNTISNSEINAPVIMAQSLQGSFNTISKGDADEGVKRLLEELLVEIAEAGDAFGENAKIVAQDASVLSEEVSGGKARRKWYELSVSGLKEAAEAIGEVGVPILKTLGKLLPALIALYP